MGSLVEFFLAKGLKKIHPPRAFYQCKCSLLSGETTAFIVVVHFLFHVKMTNTLLISEGGNCVWI